MAIHDQIDEIIQQLTPLVKSFHLSGQMAPHAAMITNDGKLLGLALTSEDGTGMSLPDAISHFESEFRAYAENDDSDLAPFLIGG